MTDPALASADETAERMAVSFARVLRRVGVAVPLSAVIAFAQSLAVVSLERRSQVYWAGRATLVHRPEDAASYDRAFAAFWFGVAGGTDSVPVDEPVMLALDDARADDEGPDDCPAEEAPPGIAVRYSPAEILRHKDFAAYSAAEHAEARRLMARIRLAGASRRSRRVHPAKKAGTLGDLRRTVRGALRTGGEPIRLSTLEHVRKRRRVVLLCDVSGSMEPYARALLRFQHAAVVGGGNIEAFSLGTRLTRLTRQLSPRDPDVALAEATRVVVDWSGGTRLGEGLRMFNDRWGVRGMARGAVVVILSDGWDRGDPAVLGEQMARLQRVAHRVIWVNPLKVSPGYAPLARGMAAALPYVDTFLEGHSLVALESLAEEIGR
jgi:uncharacterized protein with von Willebrand factor type A (vWA) domain